MKKILIAILLVIAITPAKAQHTLSGTIEYARSLNIQRAVDYMDGRRKEWAERYLKDAPKFNRHYYNLSFTTKHSVYEPGKASDQTTDMWFARIPVDENVVYTDYTTKTVVAKKQVYEERFILKDSMRKIDWKIYDEVRTIANYKCRKAVGVMLDSVYVIAFYAEDIPVSGGPEMFGNLPGMILEIAIPRLHTTWIATKVDIETPDEEKIAAPKKAKGKEVTAKEMYDIISSSLERWGDYGERIVWWSVI